MIGVDVHTSSDRPPRLRLGGVYLFVNRDIPVEEAKTMALHEIERWNSHRDDIVHLDMRPHLWEFVPRELTEAGEVGQYSSVDMYALDGACEVVEVMQ